MPYPATLELDAPPQVANWRPLVHWLLAIPHLAIAYVLQNVGSVIAIVSWFAILFTGELPQGLANLQCMILRYSARAYSYTVWLREPYPAFDFTMTPEDPGGDPLRVDVAPTLTGRNRLTVALRFLWIIPAAIFGALLAIAATFALIVGFFAVLFTGEWPDGVRDFVVRCGRYFVRLSAYADLLTDEYPPFALE